MPKRATAGSGNRALPSKSHRLPTLWPHLDRVISDAAIGALVRENASAVMRLLVAGHRASQDDVGATLIATLAARLGLSAEALREELQRRREGANT